MVSIRPRWRKVLRDLWDNKARTVLVVLAIAVGVFAFGGVFITQEVLVADMNNGYQSINPASITMEVSNFDDELLNAVRSYRSVENAQARASYYVQLLTEDRQYNLQLFAIRDFNDIEINRITPEAGRYPPERREIVLERTALPVTGYDVGDNILIELADGEQRELSLVGTVHDFNAVPAGLFPIITGYISFETLQWLEFPGDYTQLNIVNAGGATDTETLEAIASDIKDRIEMDGFTVGSVTTQDPTTHWAADVTKAFTTILLAIGFFSLFLSGFLVVNTISAVIAQQKRQIGMMKSVGATGRQVLGLYLTMVAAFGLLGLVVAVPLSLVLGYISTVSVANFLNIDILNFRLPFRIFVLEVLAALVVPLVAALLPILSGTRVTVREAVSDYGISVKSKSGLIDRLLERLRGLPRPTMLSIRNTFRRKGRLMLTLGTLTLAGMMFISVISVRGALLTELDNILKLYGFNIQVYLDDAYPVSRLQREAGRVAGVNYAEGWAFAEPQIIHDDNSEGSTFTLFGPPIDTPFVEPVIEEGRWLEEGDQNAIVMSTEALRDEPDIHVGDEITIQIGDEKKRWEVVGIVQSVGDATAYANFDYLSRVLGAPGRAYGLMVGTNRDDDAYETEIAQALEDRLKRSGIGVGVAFTRSTIIGANISQFNFLISFMLSMAIFLAVVGGLGLAGTMSLNVLERTREIGVMRSIGARQGAVRSVVIAEGLLIGLISWALGAVLALPGSIAFGYALGVAFFERPLPFSYSLVGVFIWLLLVLVIAAVASLLPARRAARISVREALAYE